MEARSSSKWRLFMNWVLFFVFLSGNSIKSILICFYCLLCVFECSRRETMATWKLSDGASGLSWVEALWVKCALELNLLQTRDNYVAVAMETSESASQLKICWGWKRSWGVVQRWCHQNWMDFQFFSTFIKDFTLKITPSLISLTPQWWHHFRSTPELQSTPTAIANVQKYSIREISFEERDARKKRQQLAEIKGSERKFKVKAFCWF